MLVVKVSQSPCRRYRVRVPTKLNHPSLQESVFHYNTFLTLELASPYFSSGLREESFEVMVMEHKGDGHARSGNVAECMQVVKGPR